MYLKSNRESELVCSHKKFFVLVVNNPFKLPKTDSLLVSNLMLNSHGIRTSSLFKIHIK